MTRHGTPSGGQYLRVTCFRGSPSRIPDLHSIDRGHKSSHHHLSHNSRSQHLRRSACLVGTVESSQLAAHPGGIGHDLRPIDSHESSAELRNSSHSSSCDRMLGTVRTDRRTGTTYGPHLNSCVRIHALCGTGAAGGMNLKCVAMVLVRNLGTWEAAVPVRPRLDS